jgi:hypothetical protein
MRALLRQPRERAVIEGLLPGPPETSFIDPSILLISKFDPSRKRQFFPVSGRLPQDTPERNEQRR